jgi:hypothetical protein
MAAVAHDQAGVARTGQRPGLRLGRVVAVPVPPGGGDHPPGSGDERPEHGGHEQEVDGGHPRDHADPVGPRGQRVVDLAGQRELHRERQQERHHEEPPPGSEPPVDETGGDEAREIADVGQGVGPVGPPPRQRRHDLGDEVDAEWRVQG